MNEYMDMSDVHEDMDSMHHMNDGLEPVMMHMAPAFWRPAPLDSDRELGPETDTRPVDQSDFFTDSHLQKEQNLIGDSNFSVMSDLSGSFDSQSISTQSSNNVPATDSSSFLMGSSGYDALTGVTAATKVTTNSNSFFEGSSSYETLTNVMSTKTVPATDGSSYLISSSGYDPLASVPSVTTSSPGTLSYTSLCLEGTPSSTLAEFQPESAPGHEGTYTLLESQKGKQVDLLEESDFYTQTKQVVCDLCGKRFENNDLLQKHKSHHEGQQPVVGQVCGKGFPFQASLDNHMVTHTDSTNKPFICEICGKHFRNHGYLKTHTKIHEVGRMYKCSLCGQGLIRLNHLKKHLELKHSKEGIFEGESRKLYTSNEFLNRTMRLNQDQRYQKKVCEYCQAELPDESSYLVHKKVHLAKGEVKCQHCDKVIYNLAYLKMHEKSHTLTKNHKCDLCGKRFLRNNHLRNHMRTHAWIRKSRSKTVVKLDIQNALTETDNKMCMICEVRFSTCKELKEHNEKHILDKGTYRCVLCDVSFDGLDSLTLLKHHMMKQHQIDKPYHCDHCDKSFHRKPQLKAHMKTHRVFKPFQCEICGQSFLKENQLKIHHASHTGEKPFKCEVCGKGFISPATLKQHLILHDRKSFICKLCYKSLPTKSNMEYHMVKVHSGENLVYCDVCSVPFSKKYYLNSHMQKSHKGYVVKGTTKCPMCPRRFSKKKSLKVHMRAHASEMPFRCDICGKGFTVESAMRTHENNHFNSKGELKESPLKCEICGRFFRIAADCSKHQLTHSQIRRYKCDLCERGFEFPHSLKRHKDTHVQMKPKAKRGRPRLKDKVAPVREYKCDLCRARFPVQELLDEHKNTHFDDLKTFECPVCGDGFRKKTALKKHQKSHEEQENEELIDIISKRNYMCYECDICEEKFRTLVEFQIHDEIHCISPNKNFHSARKDNECVKVNSRKVQGRPRGRPRLNQIKKPLKVKHIRKKIVGRLQTKSLSSKNNFGKQDKRLGPRKLRFKCNQCSLLFANIPNLNRHLKSHRDLIHCVICKESFCDSLLLEEHLESHTEDSFSCEVCQAPFSHFIDLQNHIAANHPHLIRRRGRPKKNPFSCSICRMTFRLMNHLEAHKMTHTAIVRLQRYTFKSHTMKLSDLDCLLNTVKCEVDINSEMFGGSTSRKEIDAAESNGNASVTEISTFHCRFEDPNKCKELFLTNNLDSSAVIHKGVSLEHRKHDIDSQNCMSQRNRLNPPEISDIPSPESSKNFDLSEKQGSLADVKRKQKSLAHLEHKTFHTSDQSENLARTKTFCSKRYSTRASKNCNLQTSSKQMTNDKKFLNHPKFTSTQTKDEMSRKCRQSLLSKGKDGDHVEETSNKLREKCDTSEEDAQSRKSSQLKSHDPREGLLRSTDPHIDVASEADNLGDEIPDKDKCFKCSVCDVFFSKSSSLENHLTLHTDKSRSIWRFHLEQGSESTYACVHIASSRTKTCNQFFDNL